MYFVDMKKNRLFFLISLASFCTIVSFIGFIFSILFFLPNDKKQSIRGNDLSQAPSEYIVQLEDTLYFKNNQILIHDISKTNKLFNSQNYVCIDDYFYCFSIDEYYRSGRFFQKSKPWNIVFYKYSLSSNEIVNKREIQTELHPANSDSFSAFYGYDEYFYFSCDGKLIFMFSIVDFEETYTFDILEEDIKRGIQNEKGVVVWQKRHIGNFNNYSIQLDYKTDIYLFNPQKSFSEISSNLINYKYYLEYYVQTNEQFIIYYCNNKNNYNKYHVFSYDFYTKNELYLGYYEVYDEINITKMIKTIL